METDELEVPDRSRMQAGILAGSMAVTAAMALIVAFLAASRAVDGAKPANSPQKPVAAALAPANPVSSAPREYERPKWEPPPPKPADEEPDFYEEPPPDPKPELLPAPTVEKAKPQGPRISYGELQFDHNLILEYIRLHSPANAGKPKDPQWRGPWPAERHGKAGKLYRIRYVTTSLDSGIHQYREAKVGRYYFLHDDLVVASQVDLGDVAKVTFCQITSPDVIPTQGKE